jgi:hypothetical protein
LSSLLRPSVVSLKLISKLTVILSMPLVTQNKNESRRTGNLDVGFVNPGAFGLPPNWRPSCLCHLPNLISRLGSLARVARGLVLIFVQRIRNCQILRD